MAYAQRVWARFRGLQKSAQFRLTRFLRPVFSVFSTRFLRPVFSREVGGLLFFADQVRSLWDLIEILHDASVRSLESCFCSFASLLVTRSNKEDG